ncbi:MAG: hypothetical protein ACFFDN_19375 [Candidatus Hodarchaeota archaeon]
MQTYNPETKQWIEACSQHKRPYGSCNCGHGVILLSAIVQGNKHISDNIYSQGMVWWKAINKTIRLRPILIEIKVFPEENKINWSNPEIKKIILLSLLKRLMVILRQIFIIMKLNGQGNLL